MNKLSALAREMREWLCTTGMRHADQVEELVTAWVEQIEAHVAEQQQPIADRCPYCAGYSCTCDHAWGDSCRCSPAEWKRETLPHTGRKLDVEKRGG